jgi:monoamine oxidase
LNTPVQVIVVGAGAAGLSAAHELGDRGCSCIVLEARDRVGGRAWTDREFFGVPVDLGCAWLHSADSNPWTRYAVEHGFEVIQRSPHWQRRIGREEATPEYTAAWRAAFACNEALIAQAVQQGLDVPVASVLAHDEHRPMFDAVMGWLMGVDTAHVSTLDYDRYEDSNCNWGVREGLGEVVSRAARGVDVRLGVEVKSIDWRGEGVRIGTSRGTLTAAAVIVTVPTAVLSAPDGIAFTPVLPVEIVEAFHGLPLGADDKVFFEMAPGTMPFEGTINFIGTDRTARTGAYETRPAGQEVLLGFFGGGYARELELRGDLERCAREQLMEIFGSDFSRHLRRALSTRWVQDRWARGSYSAALPGHATMRERLSTPVADRIFFAGEAASVRSFGTIHGARETGIDAARGALAALGL